MKNKIKVIIPVIILFAFNAKSSAQNAEASVSSELPTIVAKVEAPAAPMGKELTIDFKNMCEKPVIVFSGPKENIRNPKINTYGGLSRYQKLYLHENEVVCLMTVDKRPMACTIIKPGTTSVEVNASGSSISGK